MFLCSCSLGEKGSLQGRHMNREWDWWGDESIRNIPAILPRFLLSFLYPRSETRYKYDSGSFCLKTRFHPCLAEESALGGKAA